MAERPIILFGEPQKAEKSKRGGGAPIFQRPSHSRQAERLAPKMAALQNAVATIKQSPMGIEAEKTLVFDVIGEADRFYTAVKNLGEDAEWIFDMPQDFLTSEDFYITKKGAEPETFIRDMDKAVIGGKVYCVLSNARAMEEMLSLWNKYSEDKDTPFPRGKTGLRDVFDSLENMDFWGYKQRIEETGILEIWKEDLKDVSLGNVKCEFELFYRSESAKRAKAEQDLKTEIETLGGEVIGTSIIPEIAYHAVLASVPRDIAESIINGNHNVSIATADQIMFFRPVGQAVVMPKENSFDVGFDIPSGTGIAEEPIIALFDGLPQENHPYLQGRLVVDDPDNYMTGSVVDARKHGTAMASLIALGDLSKLEHTATRKIYVRPIMKPTPWMNGDYLEQTPEDSLLVDKIHVAVRRLFEGADAVSPNIKVINLSIGLSYRQFDRSMSPLARLLDWLSYKYKILFIVSAGNHPNSIDTGMPFSKLVSANMSDRDRAIITHMDGQKRNLRLLSPAESMNALTIGSTFEDGSSFTENSRQILPCSDGLITASSAVGTGMNNAVKPDIVFPGGRSCIKENLRNGSGNTIVDWQDIPTREPGIAAAAPGGKVSYTFGTSNSTAIVSHEASRCYDTLLDVFSVAEEDIPYDYLALLIKAMLVHGAEWGALTEKYANILNLFNKAGKISHQDCSRQLHRYFGFGKPNIERAIECARNRVTLIGYGELKNEEALTYDLPLPFNFSSAKICRRLTATLAYFSPIIPTRQKYRVAQCWYSIENGKKNFLDSRLDVDWQAAVRGSLQHEIFENNDIVVWDEDAGIQIKVNCRGDADERFDGSIPYALMVSFEIKDAIDIDVYAKIVQRISPKVSI
jgi:hypothetical protein